ncbi:type IV pilus modification PilV family protein [Aquibacillus saliphilus]|uniref:type IV pilus modification PilV family protein n=1 Tax=Aquibacillus saliphilus TaxID=1909422 RepID=UPI001CF0589A|nr:type II secretion system protein [Aquibacillus saliphilus]
MKKLKFHLNNNGFTLVELLAAITILSIVIISFLGFFSQSTLFSSKTDDKLTALNVAERILSEVKNDPTKIPYEPEYIEVNGKLYFPDVTMPSAVDDDQEQREDKLGLNRIHVKIYTSEDFDRTPDAELYSYTREGD